jgi:hypothetical protein
MFRLLSRVVVVSVFALSLNFAMVPAAQARMQVDRKAAVSNKDGSCIEHAMGWLDRILGKKVQKSPKKKATANDGGCIDPMGHPRPCT